MERIKELHEPERNTVTVDYTHIDQFDNTLAELMQMEFYRCVHGIGAKRDMKLSAASTRH